MSVSLQLALYRMSVLFYAACLVGSQSVGRASCNFQRLMHYPTLSVMDYHKSLNFCQSIGVLTGIALPTRKTVEKEKRIWNKIFIFLQRACELYPLLVTCFIVTLNFDFLFQRYPNVRNYLSDWILTKGKDVAFTFMGNGLVISSLLLRKPIQRLYNLMNGYSQNYYLKMREDLSWLNTCSLVLMVLHSVKIVISETYDMIWKWEERGQIKRFLIPSDPEVNWDAFYTIYSLTIWADFIQIMHQGYVMMFLVVGASFISDAFKSLQSDLEQEIRLNASFNSHMIVATKFQNGSNLHTSLNSQRNGRLTRLKQKWDMLLEIYEAFAFVGGVYLCIMFPGISLGFVTRLASGILNAFYWEWSTHGSRVYSGMVCFLRAFLLIEVGHRFKTEIKKSQAKLSKTVGRELDEEQNDRNLRPLINEILNQNWSLNALGFFELHRGITTSVISTSMTYFVIIFQLRSTEKQ